VPCPLSPFGPWASNAPFPENTVAQDVGSSRGLLKPSLPDDFRHVSARRAGDLEPEHVPLPRPSAHGRRHAQVPGPSSHPAPPPRNFYKSGRKAPRPDATQSKRATRVRSCQTQPAKLNASTRALRRASPHSDPRPCARKVPEDVRRFGPKAFYDIASIRRGPGLWGGKSSLQTFRQNRLEDHRASGSVSNRFA